MALQRERECRWRGLVQEYERSGGSQAAFAAQRGVAASSLARWVRRLGRSRSECDVKLVRVEVAQVAERASGVIEGVLADGSLVRFGVGIEVAFVARFFALYAAECRRC